MRSLLIGIFVVALGAEAQAGIFCGPKYKVKIGRGAVVGGMPGFAFAPQPGFETGFLTESAFYGPAWSSYRWTGRGFESGIGRSSFETIREAVRAEMRTSAGSDGPQTVGDASAPPAAADLGEIREGVNKLNQGLDALESEIKSIKSTVEETKRNVDWLRQHVEREVAEQREQERQQAVIRTTTTAIMAQQEAMVRAMGEELGWDDAKIQNVLQRMPR